MVSEKRGEVIEKLVAKAIGLGFPVIFYKNGGSLYFQGVALDEGDVRRYAQTFLQIEENPTMGVRKEDRGLGGL